MRRRAFHTILLPLAAALAAATICGPVLGRQDPAAPSPRYEEAIRSAMEAFSRDDTASGLAALDRALRLHPEGSEAFELLGVTYQRLGKYAEASAAYQRAATLLGPTTPKGLDILCALAGTLAREERNEEAIATLRRVLEVSPRRPAVHHDIGMIHLSLGQLEAAAAEFREEIGLHPAGEGAPADSKAAAALAASHGGLGIASYRLGDDETAIDALAKAPDSLDVVYHRGLALARTGRNEEAIGQLRRVLAMDPDHRGALQSLARAAGALGLQDERKEALQKFQLLYNDQVKQNALDVKVKDLRGLATREAEVGDFAAGARALEEAAALVPDDIELLFELGRFAQRAGDRGRAMEVFQQVLQRDPFYAEAHYRLGRLRAETGDIASAIASLEEACRIQPLELSFHLYLAQAYLRTNRAEEGVRELRLARQLNPDDPDSYFNLGLGLAQMGALPEAARELDKAVELGYSNPVIHQILSQIHTQLGNAERGRQEMELFRRKSAGGREQP